MIYAKGFIDSIDFDIKSINIARCPSGDKYEEVVT
jgi:hypothetical protein